MAVLSSSGTTLPLEGSGGGGASGRAARFSLSRLGSNPGMDLGFFLFTIAIDLFMVFLIRRYRMVHTLPSI